MNHEITTAKQELRTNMKKILSEIPKDERTAQSKQLLKMLTDSDLYQGSKSILLYMSVGTEVETKDLIRRAIRDGKKVYLPRVLGERIEFFRVEDLSELTVGSHGIPEPEEDPAKVFPYSLHESLESAQQCLVILPGLAYDHALHRLGKGGGYYDRFLSRFHKCMKIGYAFSQQIVDEVPADSHDVNPDLILTVMEVIH